MTSKERIINLTGSHGLKSAAPYDFSRNIAETTHHSFRFAEYQEIDGNVEWTGRFFECILATQELFALLANRLTESVTEVR